MSASDLRTSLQQKRKRFQELNSLIESRTKEINKLQNLLLQSPRKMTRKRRERIFHKLKSLTIQVKGHMDDKVVLVEPMVQLANKNTSKVRNVKPTPAKTIIKKRITRSYCKPGACTAARMEWHMQLRKLTIRARRRLNSQKRVVKKVQTYCVCKNVAYGTMIACDSKRCSVEWFHVGCMKVTSIPSGKWFCPKCKPVGPKQNI